MYYSLIRQYIGPVDDVIYKFKYEVGGMYYYSPIKHINDVFESQYNAYTDTTGKVYANGRFVIYSIVQCLTSFIVGKECYYVLSTIIFVLLLIGLKN